MSETTTYPLRLPRSIKAAVEKMAQNEGISINQFVATAVAEKLASARCATTRGCLITRAVGIPEVRERVVRAERDGPLECRWCEGCALIFL